MLLRFDLIQEESEDPFCASGQDDVEEDRRTETGNTVNLPEKEGTGLSADDRNVSDSDIAGEKEGNAYCLGDERCTIRAN